MFRFFKYSVLISSLFLSLRLFSQFQTLGARQVTVTASNSWATHNNPGAIAFVDSFQVALSYQNRFFLSALGYQGLAITTPTKKHGVFGLVYAHSGIELLNQNLLELSYALKISPNTSIGIGLNYFYWVNPAPYTNYHGFSGTVGVLMHPIEKLKVGTSIQNPSISFLNREDRIPTIIKLGAQYEIHKSLEILIEGVQSSAIPFSFNSGLIYKASKILDVNIGIKTYVFSPFMGFQLHLKRMHVAFSANFHQRLGLISTAELKFKL